jgi:hypothetical protein
MSAQRQEHAVTDRDVAAAARSRSITVRQGLLREVNEQIERLGERIDMIGPVAALCECGRPDCAERIEISEAEYEAVRRFPTRFVVSRGHERDEDERVVEKHDGYLVTEKVGESCLDAIRFDPRRRIQRADGGHRAGAGSR